MVIRVVAIRKRRSDYSTTKSDCVACKKQIDIGEYRGLLHRYDYGYAGDICVTCLKERINDKKFLGKGWIFGKQIMDKFDSYEVKSKLIIKEL